MKMNKDLTAEQQILKFLDTNMETFLNVATVMLAVQKTMIESEDHNERFRFEALRALDAMHKHADGMIYWTGQMLTAYERTKNDPIEE
jgi:uncharacterized protein (DUF1786 family)